MNNIRIEKISDINYAKDITNIWACGFFQKYNNFDINIVKGYLKNDKFLLYGAFFNNELIGVVCYYIYNDYVYLKWISVLYKYRKVGIGSVLLSDSLKEICCLEKDIMLYCNTDKLEKFYKQHGFITYEQREEEQLMYKNKSKIREMVLTKNKIRF